MELIVFSNHMVVLIKLLNFSNVEFISSDLSVNVRRPSSYCPRGFEIRTVTRCSDISSLSSKASAFLTPVRFLNWALGSFNNDPDFPTFHMRDLHFIFLVPQSRIFVKSAAYLCSLVRWFQVVKRSKRAPACSSASALQFAVMSLCPRRVIYTLDRENG